MQVRCRLALLGDDLPTEDLDMDMDADVDGALELEGDWVRTGSLRLDPRAEGVMTEVASLLMAGTWR